MNIKTMQNRQFALNAFIYIGSFILFWEWLRPLEEITDTENIFIFVLYTAFCFFLSYMQLQWWITSPLKLLGLLFILDGLFFYDPFFSKGWREQFVGEISFNFSAIFDQQWWEMTPVFRSLLFLVLLWLMSYLLYYWFVVAKRVLFFVLLTFIYLTVIDTFTVYDAKIPIIRTFLISLIIVGLANFQRVLVKEKIFRIPKERYVAWIMPLVSIILLSSFLGFIAPKFSPQWPDPVPFLKSAAEGISGEGSGPGIKKVGYGENDERLGGSFLQDESLVFNALVEDAQYWKIETKDVYTGKGWIRSDEDEAFVDSVNGQIDMRDFSELVETEGQEGSLKFNQEELLPKLAYPYGVSVVDHQSDRTIDFKYREQSNEIYAFESGDEIPLSNYTVSFDQPTYSLKALREVSEEDPEELKAQYTQLPEELPTRIADLALELTQDETTRYDKAKAIESYLKSTRFRYQTTGVAVPGRDEDYVDQFLFETQVGYCDNYSTSMVVMLRTLDIPARWVKGFAPGENVGMQENGKYLYEVTNSNAHSWVEVYFPQIGWVPFEPTNGFYNPTDFTSGLDLEELLQNAGQTPDVPANNMPKPTPDIEKDTEGKVKDSNSFFRVAPKFILYSLIVLVLIAGILYLTRFKWLSRLKIRKYKKKSDIDTYIRAYKFLLTLLAHKGIKLKTDQTLREFAYEVDQRFQSHDMRRLTNGYERILYREESEQGQWNKMRDPWEALINRLLN